MIVRVSLVAAIFLASMMTREAARASGVASSQKSLDGVWQESSPLALAQITGRRPERFRTLKLDAVALARALAGAPREVSGRPLDSKTVVSLPLPEGGFASFRVEESPVLAPELVSQYPEIKSYRGQGVDDSSMSVRLDWTPRGFHALIASGSQTFAVQPANLEEGSPYLAYSAADMREDAEDFICNVRDPDGSIGAAANRPAASSIASVSATVTGPQLRVYRIAIATTQEYTNAPALGGGSVSSTIASINTWLNGINLIYEKELAIRFVLIANNASIIYTAEPDPFTNGNNLTMADENRALLPNLIGAANFDVGHVLGTIGGGASGLAYIAAGCRIDYKGGGATLIAQGGPVGNTGYVGVLVHEFGHQLGAAHSFNAYCSNNRNPDAAWEPGSGLTVMTYAGQCSPDLIVNTRLLSFHSGSIAQIASYFNSSLGNCAVQSATGDSAPVVNGGPDYTIPKSTPFALSGVASDVDAQDSGNLLYSWEQVDSGGSSYLSPPYTDAGDPSSTTRPIFRPFPTTTNPVRVFPSLNYILSNANVPPAIIGGFQTAENLPAIGRDLNFNLIVRDSRGGTSLDSVRLTVASSAGPFQVTAPNGADSWEIGSSRIITWNVNGTNAAPVNCTQVRISLSTDGGQTFPTVLAASTPNDGSEAIVVPGTSSTNARVKVEAVGNIFFDVSDANFSIVPANSCPAVTGLVQTIGTIGSSVDINGINLSGVTSVKFGGGVTAAFSVVNSTRITATVPSGAVSGPVRLSKAGCADGVSATFTVASSPPASLAVDDGGFEGAYTFGGWAVNRLTPTTYPATLATVSIYFAAFSNVQPGTSITLLVGTNTDGDSNINGTSFQTIAATVQAIGQWNQYYVPNVTINSGDFVVGFRYTPTSGVFPVLYDKNLPSQGRSYASSDGNTFVLQDTFGSNYVGNAAIRAAAFQGPGQAPPPAPLTINSTTIQRSQNGNVTIDLAANGGTNGENTVSFSVGFDATQLSFVSAAPGSSGASVTANTTQTGSGFLGLTVSKPAGTAFSAGSNQIAVVTFLALSGGTQTSTLLSFGDGPVPRAITAIGGQSLPATWANGTVTIAPPGILEGDVSPRPNGNGTISVADWVQVGRFSTSLDVPSAGSEFQRADCAPRSTLGDGKITVADWVQAGRYSVGLDPWLQAGGPTSAQATESASLNAVRQSASSHRVMRMVAAQLRRGERGTVEVEFEASGDESGVAFTINFDPSAMSFIDAIAEQIPNAGLVVNLRKKYEGRVAIALALPPGQTFAAGRQRLLALQFIPIGGAGSASTQVTFDDSVIDREIVTLDAVPVSQVKYEGASLAIDGSALAVVSAASFASGVMAPEGIASIFGKGLSEVEDAAATEPLPLYLGGISVTVRDSAGVVREAPLFFVSPGQINFQIPGETALGVATIEVRRGDGTTKSGVINIAKVAPGLFAVGRFAAGNTVRIGLDGSLSYGPLIEFDPASNQVMAVPIDVADADGEVYLVLYGTGIRGRHSIGDVSVRIGGIELTPQYAGAHGSLTGLDQVNIRLPREMAHIGEVQIELLVDGAPANVPAVRIR
jgi:uncharacterized protein (TIGR03437 family)